MNEPPEYQLKKFDNERLKRMRENFVDLKMTAGASSSARCDFWIKEITRELVDRQIRRIHDD